MSYVTFLESDKVTLSETLTVSTWTGNLNNLTTAFTGSPSSVEEQLFTSATSSANFYLNVFQTQSHDSSGDAIAEAEVQYAVAFGNRIGCGSVDFTNDTGSMGNNAARCVYSQYHNMIYGDEYNADTSFKFGTHVADSIYVINLNRSRLKHNLKPGSLNLKVSASIRGGLSHAGTAYNDDHDIFDIELTDDSVTEAGSAEITNLGRRFNVVSGANGVRSGSNANQIGGSASFGHFYPDAGLIILNPDCFGYGSSTLNEGGLRPQLNESSTTNTDKNTERLFQAISGAQHFILDSEEDIISQYYFARARNNEFNYTNNPTFVTGSGVLKYASMITNPKTYITTVGLYNNNLDLLAVAKLSQPIAKDRTKEALIRIKLDY